MEFRTKIDGQEYRVIGQVMGPQIWMHINGRTIVLERNPQRLRRGKNASETATGHILAPMPGKITKVMIETSEIVEKGQPLLVMEAMKMEYTLKADMNGKVVALNCKEGEQVSLGKLLIEIKSESDNKA